MSRPVLPYGFEARLGDSGQGARIGAWTVVSEVDWYQVRLDLNSLGMSSEEWLELLLRGKSSIDRVGRSIHLRMWPVIGQRNGRLFLGLGSERHFRGGEPVQIPPSNSITLILDPEVIS